MQQFSMRDGKSEAPAEINPNNFIFIAPTVVSDAEMIRLRNKGSIAELLILQFRTFGTKKPKVDVAASVRINGGINGLKRLRATIDTTIRNFEEREP